MRLVMKKTHGGLFVLKHLLYKGRPHRDIVSCLQPLFSHSSRVISMRHLERHRLCLWRGTLRERQGTPGSTQKGDGGTPRQQAYLSASEAVPFLVCFWMLDLSDFLECLWEWNVKEIQDRWWIKLQSHQTVKKIRHEQWQLSLTQWFCQKILSQLKKTNK